MGNSFSLNMKVALADFHLVVDSSLTFRRFFFSSAFSLSHFPVPNLGVLRVALGWV